MSETVVVYKCGDEDVIGVLHQSGERNDYPAIVFVVGGPQYRVGSHRMFVRLARSLGSQGFDAFRFDCRGMGDSDGRFESFESLDEDLAAALDCVFEHVGSNRAVMIGLCDGASAIAMYAHRDPRIVGVVMLNPWVRTETTEAQALVQTYYSKRWRQATFWIDVLAGKANPVRSIREYFRVRSLATNAAQVEPTTYIDRMQCGLQEFLGPVLTILSEQDLTAQEFANLCEEHPDWRALRDKLGMLEFHDNDHTFSKGGAVVKLAEAIGVWIRSNLSSPACCSSR